MSEAAVSILSKMSMYRNNWKNIVITHPGNHKISYMANKNQNYQGNSKVSMAAMKFFFCVCIRQLHYTINNNLLLVQNA
jgi:hypothetical protein